MKILYDVNLIFSFSWIIYDYCNIWSKIVKIEQFTYECYQFLLYIYICTIWKGIYIKNDILDAHMSAWAVYDMKGCLNSSRRGIMEGGFECSLSHF